jgi:hypothetical protein
MKRIIDQLNAKMPSFVNTDNAEYLAIWGKTEYSESPTIVESEDYNCGAIANELEFLRSYLDYLTRAESVEDFAGDVLDEVIFYFLGLTRFFLEEDESVRNRFNSLILRQGNTSWITKWCIADVFSYFLSEDNIYVIENYVEVDLLTNGDFENALTNWSTSQSGSTTVARATGEPFSESYSIEFAIDIAQSEGSLERTLTSLAAATYTSIFFYKDDGNADGDSLLEVLVTRASDGNYFDFDTLTWSAAERTKQFASVGDHYEVGQFFFTLSGTDDVTITFRNAGGSTVAHTFYVDSVRLGVKESYPNVKVVLVSIGQAGDFLSLWPTGADPVGGTDEAYASFLDIDFIGGEGSANPATFFANILDRLKAAGVKGAIETVSRAV